MTYALSNACTYVENYNPHTYTFSGPCVVTGKTHSVTVHAQQLFYYHQGQMIQDAFPNMSDEDREWCMSGTSPEGWDKLFCEPEHNPFAPVADADLPF